MHLRQSKQLTRRSTKWVGFDMDECLGSFMSLWPFVELLPEDARMSNDQKTEYLKDIATRIEQLFRPEIPELVRKLKKAQQDGNIAGCFILTNNGSKELAEVVRLALNHMASKELFPVVWYRYSRCRQRSENPRKDWDTIQACLRESGLPTMNDYSDLLFYDDQEHVLASEIPHYIMVPEYTQTTPVDLVFHRIRPILQRHGVSGTVQQAILKKAYADETKETQTFQGAFPVDSLDRFLRATVQLISTNSLVQPGGGKRATYRISSKHSTRKMVRRRIIKKKDKN